MSENKKPYIVWACGDKELKLKLTTSKIVELEDKYKCNLISLISRGGEIPPLAIMLNVTHAAAQKFEHGIKYKYIEEMFDEYIENGGSQIDFMTNVFLPIFQVSGFLSQAQANQMDERLEEAKERL